MNSCEVGWVLASNVYDWCGQRFEADRFRTSSSQLGQHRQP